RWREPYGEPRGRKRVRGEPHSAHPCPHHAFAPRPGRPRQRGDRPRRALPGAPARRARSLRLPLARERVFFPLAVVLPPLRALAQGAEPEDALALGIEGIEGREPVEL